MTITHSALRTPGQQLQGSALGCHEFCRYPSPEAAGAGAAAALASGSHSNPASSAGRPCSASSSTKVWRPTALADSPVARERSPIRRLPLLGNASWGLRHGAVTRHLRQSRGAAPQGLSRARYCHAHRPRTARPVDQGQTSAVPHGDGPVPRTRAVRLLRPGARPGTRGGPGHRLPDAASGGHCWQPDRAAVSQGGPRREAKPEPRQHAQSPGTGRIVLQTVNHGLCC